MTGSKKKKEMKQKNEKLMKTKRKKKRSYDNEKKCIQKCTERMATSK